MDVSVRDAVGSVAGESAQVLRLEDSIILHMLVISSLRMSFMAQKVMVMLATVRLG